MYLAELHECLLHDLGGKIVTLRRPVCRQMLFGLLGVIRTTRRGCNFRYGLYGLGDTTQAMRVRICSGGNSPVSVAL